MKILILLHFLDMSLNTIILDNAKFDDDNFDEDDPQTIIHVRLMAWSNKYNQRQAFKEDISKESMSLTM